MYPSPFVRDFKIRARSRPTEGFSATTKIFSTLFFPFPETYRHISLKEYLFPSLGNRGFALETVCTNKLLSGDIERQSCSELSRKNGPASWMVLRDGPGHVINTVKRNGVSRAYCGRKKDEIAKKKPLAIRVYSQRLFELNTIDCRYLPSPSSSRSSSVSPEIASSWLSASPCP